MSRLYRLVFVLIRVLRLWFPGRDDACSGPCYRPLKHGFFVEGFSFLDGLLGVLIVVVAIVPGRDPSIVLLLQFVPQCEEGGVELDSAVERVWTGKPCILHESWTFRFGLPLDVGLLEVYNMSSLRNMCPNVWFDLVPSDCRLVFLHTYHQTLSCFANVVAAAFLTIDAIHYAWLLFIFHGSFASTEFVCLCTTRMPYFANMRLVPSETSATTNCSPEISTSLSFFINSPGGGIFRTISKLDM